MGWDDDDVGNPKLAKGSCCCCLGYKLANGSWVAENGLFDDEGAAA